MAEFNMNEHLKLKYRVYGGIRGRKSARGNGNQGKARTKVADRNTPPPAHRTKCYIHTGRKLRVEWR